MPACGSDPRIDQYDQYDLRQSWWVACVFQPGVLIASVPVEPRMTSTGRGAPSIGSWNRSAPGGARLLERCTPDTRIPMHILFHLYVMPLTLVRPIGEQLSLNRVPETVRRVQP